MKTVCEKNMCAGCMACVDICPKNAISIKDNLSYYNSVIDQKECVDCNLCQKVCPNNNEVEKNKPIEWHQGWAENSEIRNNSSSGGLATAIASSFVRSGGIVYSCCFEKGCFYFSKALEEKQIEKFVGSKYVKSNPIGVYNAIKTDLINGTTVLFVGLPCQVAALKKYIGKKYHEMLYTIDLICHGTPSPKLLDIFLNQYNKPLKSMNKISFRLKEKMQIWGDDKGIITKGVSDKYTIAFVNGLTYTQNCYDCKYARIERVSDITLGDSWGSQLPEEEKKRGISLLLCQTKKGQLLINNSDLILKDVDLEEAISNNNQLSKPSLKPENRELFFNNIKNGKRFNTEVMKCYFRQCFKQDVKEKLLQLKIIK